MFSALYTILYIKYPQGCQNIIRIPYTQKKQQSDILDSFILTSTFSRKACPLVLHVLAGGTCTMKNVHGME